LTKNRKKPVPVVLDETPKVVKVVRQIHINQAETMGLLEAAVNEFLPKLNYNDITEPAVELYYFKDTFYAKIEYDLKIKDRQGQQAAKEQTTL
jgi:hypothetical protein